MPTDSYQDRRGQIAQYFDKTALDAWARMTSDAPLSRVRRTVRNGRETMRRTLISFLPDNLSGHRVLDAGCGTGMLAVELAHRGAEVVAIDLSPNLISIARARTKDFGRGTVAFLSGDMLDPALGRFDHVVAMDSLIHYKAHDIVGALSQLASRTTQTIAFTFAPRTVGLSAMHAVGKLFPRADRAPAIEPVRELLLRQRIREEPSLADWEARRTERVVNGFYTSQAMELGRR
ncbi:MAG: magnesium protoporphyrin IX methyltransferase [Hyphomicrobiaceae bacterium]